MTALRTYNITPLLVANTLKAHTNGIAIQDVGTLCTHPNVNIWSLCKPAKSPDKEYKTGSTSGLTITRYFDQATGAFGVIGWNKPTGQPTDWFRLLDFAGYDHEALAPFVTSAYVQIYCQWDKLNTYSWSTDIARGGLLKMLFDELLLDGVQKVLLNTILIYKDGVYFKAIDLVWSGDNITGIGDTGEVVAPREVNVVNPVVYTFYFGMKNASAGIESLRYQIEGLSLKTEVRAGIDYYGASNYHNFALLSNANYHILPWPEPYHSYRMLYAMKISPGGNEIDVKMLLPRALTAEERVNILNVATGSETVSSSVYWWLSMKKLDREKKTGLTFNIDTVLVEYSASFVAGDPNNPVFKYFHGGPVLSMQVSYDKSHVDLGPEDGVLLIFNKNQS